MMNIISEEYLSAEISRMSIPSRLGEKNKLEPMRQLLEKMGNPEKQFKSVLIGGTSGKGSTATFLYRILQTAGYRVGLYTKPHLFSVRERIVVDSEMISAERMLAYLENIGDMFEKQSTWFELTTAVAFQYFADQKVDFGIIEVGLGGRFDATNTITPLLSILTNVGLDHTDVLGNTIEEIAADKVGIIKQGIPVITGVTQPSVLEIVNRRCDQTQSDVYIWGQDFTTDGPTLSQHGSQFTFTMGEKQISDITTVMSGRHQVGNACLAIAAACILEQRGYPVRDEAIQEGISSTCVPGRLEVVRENPLTVLDGAHSPPKMQALVESIQTLFSERRKLIGVLAFSEGHDLKETLRPLAPLLDIAVLTRFSAETDYGNKRARDPNEIASVLYQLNPKVTLFIESNPGSALELAQERALDNDLICVTGSIYLVGQIKQGLQLGNGGESVSNIIQSEIK